MSMSGAPTRVHSMNDMTSVSGDTFAAHPNSSASNLSHEDKENAAEMGVPTFDERASEKGGNVKPPTAIPPLEPTPIVGDVLDFPDGGLRAWLVVLGSWFLTFSTFGFANSWGVWQEHYATTILPHESSSNIAWIGSVQYALVLFPGIVSGRLMDLGYLHIPLSIAMAAQIIGVFLTAECTEYWQFLLCQGFLVGIGAGFSFGPSIAVVAHWFHKRRPIAFGIIATGSSAGGVVFPLAAKTLINEVGFKWTMRITGFLCVVTLGLAFMLVKKRLPPKEVEGGMFNLPVFKNMAYSLYAAACVIGFLGVYTVLTFSDVAAMQAGYATSFSLSLVAICNGSSAMGRLLSGHFASRIGPISILIPFTFIAGIMTYCWPYATNASTGPMVIVLIIYGMSSGAFVGLIAAPLSDKAFGQQADIGRRIGMVLSLCAIGALCGPPISGAIRSKVGNYEVVGWYAGSLTIISCVMLLFVKKVATGKFLTRF